jgi:uncharacterized surface protein with fasciclin (FAS1) repeats
VTAARRVSDRHWSGIGFPAGNIKPNNTMGERKEMNLKSKIARWMFVGLFAVGLTVTPVGATDNHMKKDIVDTAVAAGSFKTLATALEAAGLVETLKGKGPFTVFAPTDEAFAKLPPGTVEALLKDKEKLTKILLYHVVSGNVMAKDVVMLKSAKTVQGSSVKIKAGGGKVMVDGANVVKTDIAASNGVIHVIDAVIIPK